jgi:hypothetical protein
VTEGRPLAAEDILRMQKQASATDLDRRFRKKPLTISGVPTSTGREANRYYVSFTSRIRCYVDRDIYERFKDALKDAQEQNREIIVTGTATGYYSTGLVLTDCEVSIPKEDAGGQRGGRAPQAERRGPREE